MKTTTKKLSDTRVEVTVTLDAADLKSARDKALARLAQNIKIQGFRQGKAPASLVEKHVSSNDIANEAIDIAVRSTMPLAFNAEKQEPIAIVGVDVTKYVPGESAEYVAKADILPDVKLGDFKKLKAKKDKIDASPADIQEVLDNIVNAYAEKVVTKDPAQTGDEVIIDFVGKRANGEEFKGGSAKDHHLVLGSGQFIPGFEEAIVGHSAGDKFDLNVTFPEDYPEKSLAGQPVVFETLIKQVNQIQKPELNDDLAQKCGNFQTVDDLKADIKHNLESQNAARAFEKYREDLVRELVKASTVSAPEVLVNDQMRFIRDDAIRNAATHGMPMEQYLERLGMTEEKWEKQAREVAEARVKSSLILQILAKEQEISATDEEVSAKIAELCDVYQHSKEAVENLKKPEVRQDIKNRLVIDKTLDFLVAANDTKTEKTTKNDKASKSSKADKAAKAEKSDQDSKTSKAKKTSKTAKTTKADKDASSTSKTTKTTKTAKSKE